MIYAGIGSRKTPQSTLDDMELLAAGLAREGFLLRSGGAPGADLAFETGCRSEMGLREIYLPWKSFNDNDSLLYRTTEEAETIAKKYHPNWDALSLSGRKFMTRNVYQVLGDDLHQITDFVVCWTPNGKTVGGTGQAIRIAEAHEIPVINMFGRSLKETILEIKRLAQIN